MFWISVWVLKLMVRLIILVLVKSGVMFILSLVSIIIVVMMIIVISRKFWKIGNRVVIWFFLVLLIFVFLFLLVGDFLVI